ncbi:hypothetical protein HDU97_010162 [Phlyctochytrium planicorne]|nr:hypothetical protein HDU97_010162 [Phlyctochytrium planicorne]
MVLRGLINRWKTINLPWKSHKFVGYDLSGNMYFEGPPIRAGTTLPRRTIDFADGRTSVWSYTTSDVPVQWSAWLRHTRPDPPTIEQDILTSSQTKELMEAEETRADMQAKVLLIEKAREEKEKEAQAKRTMPEPEILQIDNSNPSGQGETFTPGSWQPSKKPDK